MVDRRPGRSSDFPRRQPIVARHRPMSRDINPSSRDDGSKAADIDAPYREIGRSPGTSARRRQTSAGFPGHWLVVPLRRLVVRRRRLVVGVKAGDAPECQPGAPDVGRISVNVGPLRLDGDSLSAESGSPSREIERFAGTSTRRLLTSTEFTATSARIHGTTARHPRKRPVIGGNSSDPRDDGSSSPGYRPISRDAGALGRYKGWSSRERQGFAGDVSS